MGIAKGAVKLFIREGKRVPLKGRILTLGKQDVWITYNELKKIAKEASYPLVKLDQIELSNKPEMKKEGFLSDKSLFLSLGFSEVFSMDFSPYENADILFDLNQDRIPEDLESKYDMIFDGGTIEHVFHVPHALKNIFSLLSVNGRVIHISPSSNHVDHGFYMFSPTLFSDFYKENRFDLHEILFIRHFPQALLGWEWQIYNQGSLNAHSYGGLDGAMYAIGCVATKKENSTGDKIPQQTNYVVGGWANKKSDFHTNSVKKFIKKIPILYPTLVHLKNLFYRKTIKTKMTHKF